MKIASLISAKMASLALGSLTIYSYLSFNIFLPAPQMHKRQDRRPSDRIKGGYPLSNYVGSGLENDPGTLRFLLVVSRLAERK